MALTLSSFSESITCVATSHYTFILQKSDIYIFLRVSFISANQVAPKAHGPLHIKAIRLTNIFTMRSAILAIAFQALLVVAKPIADLDTPFLTNEMTVPYGGVVLVRADQMEAARAAGFVFDGITRRTPCDHEAHCSPGSCNGRKCTCNLC